MLNSLINSINSTNMSKKMAYSDKVRLSTYHQIAKLTNNGISFAGAILELRNHEIHGGNIQSGIKTPMYYVYDDVLRRQQSGLTIAKAFTGYATETDRMMISAFENEDIAKGFDNLVEYNQSIKAMNKAFKGALAYPIFLLVMFIGVLSYFCIKLIPQLTMSLSSDTPLSGPSDIMITLSHTYWVWFPIFMGILIVLFMFLIWALPNLNNKLRIALENIPPFSMYRITMGCSFLSALSSLTKSGIQQADAILQMERDAKPYLKYRLQILFKKITEGQTLGEALITSKLNFPDKAMIKPIAILAKHGIFEDSMDKMTQDLNEEGLEIIQKQALGLKVILMAILMGGIMLCFTSVYTISQDMAAGAEQTQNK